MPDALERLRSWSATVVCLPDLFLDHVIHLPAIDEAEATLREVHGQGGGKVLDVPQQLLPGGNAANAAHALARLGARARLVGRTSERGRAFFEATMGADGVDLDLVASDGELAATAVLAYGDEGTNVMLNDPGSLRAYGSGDLTPEIEAAIREADAVLVGNWASTTENGTDLVARVCRLADDADTLSYLDAADPSRREDPTALVEALVEVPLDVWAMNDAEARLFAGLDDAREAARRLADRTGARVDVHDARRARSVGEDTRAAVAGFDVEPAHLTGAGDAFNAGNLAGDLLGLDPVVRLRLAHAVAAETIADPDGRPPDRDRVRARLDGEP